MDIDLEPLKRVVMDNVDPKLCPVSSDLAERTRRIVFASEREGDPDVGLLLAVIVNAIMRLELRSAAADVTADRIDKLANAIQIVADTTMKLVDAVGRENVSTLQLSQVVAQIVDRIKSGA